MPALAGRTSLGTTTSAEIEAAGGRRVFLDPKHPSCRIWAEAAAGASSKRPLTWEDEANSPRPFAAVAPVRIRYGVPAHLGIDLRALRFATDLRRPYDAGGLLVRVAWIEIGSGCDLHHPYRLRPNEASPSFVIGPLDRGSASTRLTSSTATEGRDERATCHRSRPWQRRSSPSPRRSHTSVTDVGGVAEAGGVKTLVPSHLFPSAHSLVSDARWKRRA